MEREDSSISKSSLDTPIAEGLEPSKPISFWRLYRFSTPYEIFLLFIGFLMSAVKALTLPAVVIVYSEFTAMLVDRTLRIGTSSKTYALPLFNGGKTLQVTRMRMKLFQAVMRQDIGWHDLAVKQNFSQNMTDDIEKIRDGISEKVGHFLYLIIGFVITVALSFAYGWKLTLAVSVYIPLVILLNYFVAKFQCKLTTEEQESYASAGNLVEEILSSIRTVVAFGGEQKESERYDNFLIPARKASQRKGAFSGFSDAVLKSMLFLSCAGAFWYGVNLILNDRNVEDKEYTPAILMIAFFGIIIGADNIARTSPFLESFSMARGCASNIFQIIDALSKIDPMSSDGKILNYGLRGDVEFSDVFFRYPARPDVIVHRGLNIKVKAGTTVALVGSSGCGKSTCLQLLQRFYDPVFGSVLLDELDIRKYNIQWLRSQMAVVGQEPVLFSGTIAENISHGKHDATQKEIEAAAKAAGVHEFISNLPESYKTIIGERGSQLSGGQKQRIAIARALIQNPKILLLDEATSALDYESEKLIQEALDFASKGRTTIVVSHRLSAIRGADKIVFINDGKVVEEGSHDDLMTLEGAYYRMVVATQLNMHDLKSHQVCEEGNCIDLGNNLSAYEKTFETNLINFDKNYKNSRQSEAAEAKLKGRLTHASKMLSERKPNFLVTFSRTLKIAKPEWCFLTLGAFCAIGFGFTYPAFSVAFGEFYAALADVDEEMALDRTAMLSFSCLGLGLITGLAGFLQTYLFNYSGVWLTTRMRSLTFKAMMRQEMAWYDEETNSVGSLSARLSGDAAGVQGAIGFPLSGLLQAFSNFVVGLTLSFYYSWKLALLCLSTCPIIVGSIIFEANFMTKSMLHEKQVLENACRIATEAITNIRTIAGLRREQQIIDKYNEEIRKVEILIRNKLRYRGIINSIGQAFLFFAYAVALCYGGVLVSEGKVPFQDIIKVSETLLYGSMMLAQSLAFAPAFTAALAAAHRLFQIIDRKPNIKSSLGPTKNTLAKQLNNYEGVRYNNIEFSYPTRPGIKILNDFNLEVLQGTTVGLVGHSGCGKSTCIQLIQRYYEPEEGSIFIDNDDIHTDMNLVSLRRKLGIVSQEPSLFERTIAENIAYGDNSRSVSMAEIIAAAKSANAHTFITSLPNGYETKMGRHGTQLSGGQKQRIAIARALVRNPKVLLLDEATSALDLQSEQLVQQALDLACTGRTCIIIAHRLSTIQNADLICILQNGHIVEQGNHHQLIAKDGIYAKLLLAALVRSLVFPIVILVYGELVAMFVDRSLGTSSVTYFLPIFDGGKILINGTHEENMQELRNDAKAFGILCGLNTALMLLSGIIYVDLFNHVALNIIIRLRCKYFEATLRQDISWHDMAENQNFALTITDNMEKIRNGISETMGHFIQLLFDIIISIIISFVYGWRLTLTISIYIPITMIVNYVTSKYQSKLTASEQNAYAKAGSVVEEVLASIRTVVAFGGEKMEEKRYNNFLEPARRAGKLKGMFSGLNDSILKGMLFISSAAAFWYGAHFILDDRYKAPLDQEYTPAVLLIVICGIIVSADHISHTAPFLEAFAVARGSAIAIFEVIEAQSKIDPLAMHGKVLNYGFKGDIEFEDVFFCYPSRPESIVLRGFNLRIKNGETVALVGYSGSGKSTCIQLLQRFYDPIFGKLYLDNQDMRKYNVHWLRSNIAMVGQEPVLFFGSIEENIRHGKMNATQKEIEEAANAAGAHEFIIDLPDGYNTLISERGVQLSGGQRQRIAIARALIQNPKILLLDEATSALDYHSEKVVQAALDTASKGRTTLVVSHRLSAIRYADRIVFIDKGRVVEDGTHENLMLQRGRYFDMVTAHEYDGIADNDESDSNQLKQGDKDYDQATKYTMDHHRFSEGSLNKNTINSFKRSSQDSRTLDNSEQTHYMKTFLRILKWSKPEWGFLLLGAVCSMLYGCTQPVLAIILADLFGSLSLAEPDEVLKRSSRTALISVIVGLTACITCLTQTYFFNLAGVWLTSRIRSITFQKVLNQDVGWFDRKENSVGAMSARLAGDACAVQGAIGFPLSNIIQAIANFICSFTIGFYYSWELALICLTTSPFMVAAILFEAKFTGQCAVKEKIILEETSRVATEAVAQICTVAALRRERDLIEIYHKHLEKYRLQIKQRLRYRGVVNSLGMSIMFLGYAITLTYGGYMCADGLIKFESIVKISNSLLYGLFILAQSLAFTPAFHAAIISANRLYNIIDREPEIKSPDPKVSLHFIHDQISKAKVIREGVNFQNINFSYPTRRCHKVLKNFNLEIMQGKTVALVGPSGSGKSTCLQLLLRYYDPNSGEIHIDQENIHQDISLTNLRSRLGVVSQEPSLFEKTIADNIAYGDTSRTVPMTEIVAAAKIANAHDFITALPMGYETCLGSRGTQLSGGQKQRIAIARALVRNPKILLLDEATSALDLQSERAVQQALSEACLGRTSIVIAHRLATVQNANLICVLRNGNIVEHGNHLQLLAQNGVYAKLYRSQPNTGYM
uniref:Uncharacterized protein n=1 Tax=Glossina austeni TaxID=7395 RepID=A0A1A9UJ85_GLOAU